MVLFLIPIVAAAAAYGAATQDESGSYSSADGDRKVDCYQIWEQITHGVGPQSLADGKDAAGRLKDNYTQRMGTIDQLSSAMDAAWTGTSGEAAKSGGHPLKMWMQDSHDKLGDTDKYLGGQHEAFTTVHSKVQEVPQKPPESGFLNDIKPWETDTDRAIKDYNTKGQANVDAFNAYFKSSGENGQGMPTYAQMSGQVQAVDVEPGTGGGDDKDGKDKDGTGSDRRPGGGIPGGGIPGGGIPGGGIPGGGIPGAPGGPPGGYKPPEFPRPGDLPGRPGGPSGPGGYQPPTWDDGTGASGYTPPKIPGPGGFGPSGSGFGPGGSGGGGDFGPGAGGEFGPGAMGGIPSAGGGSGAGGLGGGGQSGAGMGMGAGAGAGGAAMGGAAAAGAAAGRGAGGMGGGMGGMGAGGGRGQGGEDQDRQARFLVGDDPNEVFGTDELTAPPVIGE